MARGSVMNRVSTWSVVLDVGPDPATGKRRQKWKGGFGTRKTAEAALRELVAGVDAGRYVERSTKTVGEYLDEWIEVVRPRLRPTTWNSYRQSVAHIKGRIGAVPLQSLAPLAVENLYKELLATRGRNGRLLSPRPSAASTSSCARRSLMRNVSGWWSATPRLQRSRRSRRNTITRRGRPSSSPGSSTRSRASAWRRRSCCWRRPGCAAARRSGCGGVTSTLRPAVSRSSRRSP